MIVPDWPEGTAAVLATVAPDGRPHAIPVSTAVRTGQHTVHLALGRRRASLVNLRHDPRCTLTVMASGDRAFTLHGRATEVDGDVVGTVGLRLDVEHVSDHGNPSFAIDSGVVWRWTDAAARERDAAVRARLRDF
jgi:pyridoxamine 5'-phosphate oxidase-like protein